jgi:hypothetical protein
MWNSGYALPKKEEEEISPIRSFEKSSKVTKILYLLCYIFKGPKLLKFGCFYKKHKNKKTNYISGVIYIYTISILSYKADKN